MNPVKMYICLFLDVKSKLYFNVILRDIFTAIHTAKQNSSSSSFPVYYIDIPHRFLILIKPQLKKTSSSSDI